LVKHSGYQDWEKTVVMNKDEDVNIELTKKGESSSRAWIWVAGGVGAVAVGATAYIITSSHKGSTRTESLPPFQWPPDGK
jgi:hypothetical protein